MEALAILNMEWNNTLASLSAPGRLLADLFQSVSARTAGFDTLDVVMIPTGRFLVKESDVLVLLGPDKALAGLKE